MAPSAVLAGPTQNKPVNSSIFHHVRWEHLAAGVSGGVISTLILHPLDLIKIRFQVNEGPSHAVTKRPQYRGFIHATKSIYHEGGIRGLYQGATPNIWGAGASWGLYFLFYNSIKNWMQDGDKEVNLGPGKHMLAAAQSGVMTLAVTNPIWVTKTRLCLQYEYAPSMKGQASRGEMNRYNGMFDCLFKIYKVEGMRGLYKGFVPGIFGVSHGALQFMAYEELKTIYSDYRGTSRTKKLSSLEYITFAALSKIFAVITTYPYQVVRSRLQDQHRSYTGIVDVIRQTWKFEHVKGFYKGLFPNLLRVTPACCITFVVYEKFTAFFSKS
ncbi:solute carrier family 25 member 32-like [Lineus longissimus]|uniref:solute carrier family 25 member 32-like n=1 Tax=Lineus longissimus TaxID=88925 RepID=UPI002B4E1653